MKKSACCWNSWCSKSIWLKIREKKTGKVNVLLKLNCCQDLRGEVSSSILEFSRISSLSIYLSIQPRTHPGNTTGKQVTWFLVHQQSRATRNVSISVYQDLLACLRGAVVARASLLSQQPSYQDGGGYIDPRFYFMLQDLCTIPTPPSLEPSQHHGRHPTRLLLRSFRVRVAAHCIGYCS